MKTVTQWFHDEKPEHMGVYEREYPDGIRFCLWSGVDFGYGYPDAFYASTICTSPSPLQELPWRGLADPA